MPQAHVDWNAVWREAHAAHADAAQPETWDKRAEDFRRIAKSSDYSGQFLELMRPEPDWSVLDMGCAAGTLAFPLARIVRSVTAADPSPRMLELLRERAEAEGVTNIRTVQAGWLSDWDGAEIGMHDVIVGSRSLIVDDLRAAMAQAQRHARKRVFLSAVVGEGGHERALLKAVGRTHRTRADYTVVLNLLREMGIFAELRFIRLERRRVYPDLDAAVADLRWMLRDMNPEEEAKLRAHLAATMSPCPEGLCRPPLPPVRWALLSWDPRTDCDGPLSA